MKLFVKRKTKRKKGKSSIEKLISWLHLWLGLIAGIIIFFVAITGTIFVFCDDIIDLVAGEAKYVSVPVDSEPLSPDELLAVFKEQEPERKAFYFDFYKAPDRSFRVASTKKKNEEDVGVLSYTYMNPYNGEILKTSNSYQFFYIVAHLHSELLMHKTSKTIVGIATIIFLIQLISGLILWIPRKWNKTLCKNAFTIKKGTNWRRKNYDFHNVLGFYSLLFALLITITGLIMAYKTLENFTQKTFGGNPNTRELIKQYEPPLDKNKEALSFHSLIKKISEENPKVKQIRLSFSKGEKSGTYYLLTGDYIGLKSKTNGKTTLINKYTGEEVNLPQDLENYNKINQTNFDLHVGSWLGIPSKIITFIIGLICASLPITGFIIWWNKERGKRKKRSKLKNL
ncbi:PepSY domain-containing protein [Weeksellaceae bacterium TAE3-ERU29]|nr:PepSY domain-containing protein [Weeksellaceae bacterium TAE3-ERU29]